MNRDSNEPEQKDWLDTLIERTNRYLDRVLFATLFLGGIYWCFFQANVPLQYVFVIAFLITIDVAGIYALLVAFREAKESGSIGDIVFYGSWGILVLVVSIFFVIGIFG